jgi:hypothetical protein
MAPVFLACTIAAVGLLKHWLSGYLFAIGVLINRTGRHAARRWHASARLAG